ncbi:MULTISPECIES: DUF1737 domain-containing protein [unclassified Paludibacterium]|uniref:DUF1737 domain-containing protein n=1 Tax=unclassified Paludibacterium TaxID=2618429 RepID=UPI001C050441|nr:DUF1737 domain-containing protein [Paludibacterium sp. B53371]BEV72265.1 DUF1737 domain-containing protein [Paludibacterium sp. THUN1379]
MNLYRVLTGPDDATFCLRVTEALNAGWLLHGPPALTFNGERVIVAQAITKQVDGEWTPEIKLSEM